MLYSFTIRPYLSKNWSRFQEGYRHALYYTEKRKATGKGKKKKTKTKTELIIPISPESLILSEQDFQGGQHAGVWSGVMDAKMVSTPLRQSRVYTIWMKLCTRQVSTKLYIWLLYYMLISFGMSPIFENSLKVPTLSQLSYVKLWGGSLTPMF